MEIAFVLALGLQDWLDAGIIAGILLLNAIVGWYQEKQAADVVASLKGDIAMKATVIRDGQTSEIRARELVPGDIIIIEEGHVVPADARLICEFDDPNGYAKYEAEMNAQAMTTEPKEKMDETRWGKPSEDPENQESGSFLSENQRNNDARPTASAGQDENPYMDEYKG